GERRGLADALNNLAFFERAPENFARAQARAEQALALFQQIGDLWGIGQAASTLGTLLMKQEAFDKARPLFERSLEIDQRLGYRMGVIGNLFNLADVYRFLGDEERAIELVHEFRTMDKKLDLNGQPAGVLQLGFIAMRRQDYLRAAEHF